MADQLPILSEEEKEIEQILGKLNATPKLARWINLFLDKSSKETYGNRTQSAIMAYNLDPQTQYYSAGVIGHENFKKLKMVASEYFEREGMTVGKQLDLLVAKAVNTNNAKYLITMMEMTGVYTPKPTIAVQNNTQNNISVQMTQERAKEFKEDFTKFINAKLDTAPVLNLDAVEQPSG